MTTLDCSALGHELQQIVDVDGASRPSTPEAQIRTRPLDYRDLSPPKLAPKWRLNDEEDESVDFNGADDLLEDALVYDGNGEAIGYYVMGKWQPLLNTADMADRAIQMIKAEWSAEANDYAQRNGIALHVLLPAQRGVC